MNTKKKKIFSIIGIALGVVALSLLLAYGLLLLTRHKNVVETGNVLGISWYKPDEYEFEITTKEELQELAKLSDFYTFEDQTIKLGADIVMNEGNAADWSEKAPETRWKPIKEFAGTFDGQGHTISGVYGKAFQSPMALFTYTDKGCEITDLKLTNSYFETKGEQGTGSFSANGSGKFTKLYSDAILSNAGKRVGGIVGKVESMVTLDECWYDGSIVSTGREIGGLVGVVLNGRATIKHCLHSGSIETNYTYNQVYAGGLIGRVSETASVNLSDTLIAGSVQAESTTYVNSTIGQAQAGSQVVSADSYECVNSSNRMMSVSYVSGTIMRRTDDLMLGTEAYRWTSLDFDNYWAAVEASTPVLKYFADSAMDLSGVSKGFDTSWYVDGVTDFEITSAEELYGLQMLSTYLNFDDITIRLGADIVVNEANASTVAAWKSGKKVPQNRWFPIGSRVLPFAGTFDGQGHTISGIYLKDTSEEQTDSGLFGVAEVGSKICNLRLVDSYFERTGQKDHIGFAGSIVSEARGTLDTIYSNATIVTDGQQVGGIAGRLNYMDATYESQLVVNNCWFDGSITGPTVRFAGGISGIVANGGAIKESAKSIVKITNCLNTGYISNTRENNDDKLGSQMIGGILGGNGGVTAPDIENCVHAGTIDLKWTLDVGTIVGKLSKTERTITITHSYGIKHETLKTIGSLQTEVIGGAIVIPAELMEGYNGYRYTELDFKNYWIVNGSKSPVLKSFAKGAMKVSEKDKMVDTSWYKADAKTLVIDSVQDLYGFHFLSDANNFKGQTVKLGADLYVNGTDVTADTVKQWVAGTVPSNVWMPIGSRALPFAGTFDGQGHTISGIYLKDTSEEQTDSGLFGVADVGSKICNLRLVDSYIERTGQKDHIGFTGSIVSEARGILDTIYSNATIVTDGQQVGGIVGRLNYMDTTYETTIIANNCWFDGSITGPTVRFAGGICGIVANGSAIKDSEKSSVKITNCLNTGYISNPRENNDDKVGSQMIGGILGGNGGVTIPDIENCVHAGTLDLKWFLDVGTIAGKLSKTARTMTITHSYGIKHDKIPTIGSIQTKVVGGAIVVPAGLMEGYNGYRYTELDFDNYWMVNNSASPVLKSFATGAMTVHANDKMVDTSWYNADAKTLVIDSVQGLYGFYFLSDANNFEGQTVKLDADIYINGKDVTADTVEQWAAGNAPDNTWLPISSGKLPFAGTFDGQGHIISGIYLKDTSEEQTHSGLFGITDVGSKICNLKLVNSYFERTGQKDKIGFLGSLASEIRGSIDTIYSNAMVVSDGQQVGGIVGRLNYMDSDYESAIAVDNCWFAGTVCGSTVRFAGGIVGLIGSGSAIRDTSKAKVEITNCLNTGTVTNERPNNDDKLGGQYLGGILGGNAGIAAVTIKKCVNAGEIATNAWKIYIGAIVGHFSTAANTVTVSKCYGVKEVCGLLHGNSAPDEEGVFSNCKVVPKKQMLGVNALTLKLNYETIWAAVAGGTPMLRSFMESKQEVTADIEWYTNGTSPYHIDEASELVGLVALVNSGTNFVGEEVQLDDDIYLNGKDDKEWIPVVNADGDLQNIPSNVWTPIGDSDTPFAGTFNGNGHKISGIYFDISEGDVAGSSWRKGLFGYCSDKSTIKNVQLTNGYMKNAVRRLGAIAGETDGKIENVYVDSSVSLKSGAEVGGLVGIFNGASNGSITKSWFAGTVYASGDNVGGIIGHIWRGTTTISDVLFSGSIYSTIASGVDAWVGGIAGGANSNGSGVTGKVRFKNCVSTGLVNTKSGNFVGSVFGSTRSYMGFSELEFENVYTTDNRQGASRITAGAIDGTGSMVISYHARVNGIPTIIKSDQLKGENGYVNTDLDFYSKKNTDGIWVATDKGPELKAFTKADYQTTFTRSRLNIDWYTAQYTNYTVSGDTKTVTGTMALPSSGVTFELDSEGDMYGFAAVLNGTTGKTVAGTALVKDPFAGDTVQLKTDVALNEGWKPEVDENGTIQNGDKAHAWPEMPWWFQGIFDGEGHVVSGAYQVATTSGRGGLFGAIQLGGTVKNLKLIDSYFKCTLTESGSIAGLLQGTLQNVYSNAYVVTSCQQSGGLIGRMQSAYCKMIDNCWYDGQMYITEFNRSSLGYFGGIVGNLQVATGEGVGKNVLRNCLFTGSVTKKVANTAGTQGAYFGGIAGGCHYDHARPIEMTNCLSVGASLDGVKDVNTSALVGLVSNANTTITGCYATRECRFRPFGNIYNGTINGNKYNATTYANGYYGMMVNKAEILGDSAKTKMPLLINDTNTAWECVENGTPILSYFADWWLARQQ